MINNNKTTWLGIGTVVLIGLLVGIGFLAGRVTSLNVQARGFELPLGDVDAGKRAFADLGCMGCHTVNEPLNGEEATLETERVVALGGEVRRLRTHGELVTAILYPNCTIKEGSPAALLDSEGNTTMPDWTDRMSARQLVDLVTYLHDQYVVVLPDPSVNWTPYQFDVGP